MCAGLRRVTRFSICRMPFLLIAAALTIVLKPTVDDLQQATIFGARIPNIFNFEYFVITSYLGLVLLAVY